MGVKEAGRAFGDLDVTKGDALRMLRNGSGDRKPGFFSTTRRKVGAVALAVALTSTGILGSKINEWTAEDEAGHTTDALLSLMNNGVIDRTVTKRLVPENKGRYDTNTHILTLNLKTDSDKPCAGPFVVAEDFKSLDYVTSYADGQPAQHNEATTPSEVESDITRFLGSQACQPEK